MFHAPSELVSRWLRFGLLIGAWIFGVGCMPPSVKAVDTWLSAYTQNDIEAMVAATYSEDRALVKEAMRIRQDDPTGALPMLLPSIPVEHELLEIESKEPGRHVVLARITMKNPLAFSAKKVGHDMPDIPRERSERRRFLSIQEGETWGVKLDLAKARNRMEFAVEFDEMLRNKNFAGAEDMLKAVPPPPDEANALKNQDRLTETLTARLEARRKETRTSTATSKAIESD